MSNVSPKDIKKECAGGQIKFHEFKGMQRKITAKIIKAAKADAITLEGVGNRAVLKKFRTEFLYVFLICLMFCLFLSLQIPQR